LYGVRMARQKNQPPAMARRIAKIAMVKSD
jgi:hypothetical protein